MAAQRFTAEFAANAISALPSASTSTMSGYSTSVCEFCGTCASTLPSRPEYIRM